MTAPCVSEQIDLERNGEREEEEMEEKGRGRHYSITVRAVFDFPTLQKIKRQISLNPPSGSRRENYFIFFADSPGARSHSFYPPSFQRVLDI